MTAPHHDVLTTIGVSIVAAAAFALVAAACATSLAPAPRCAAAPARRVSLDGARLLARAAGSRRLVVLAALTVAMSRVALSATGPYLGSLGVPLALVGVLTAAGAALAAFIVRRAVPLADRFGEHALLSLLPVALLGVHLAMGLGGGTGAVVLGLAPQIIAGLHAPVWRAHLNARITDPARRATVLAVDATCARLGHTLLSSLLALLGAGGGPRAALLGCAALGALGLLALALMPNHRLGDKSGLQLAEEALGTAALPSDVPAHLERARRGEDNLP